MRNGGILPDFAGVVVLDRYQNYFPESWEHVAGNQACAAHYPDIVVMPIPGRWRWRAGVPGLAVSA
jgi:hypothetical protein